MTASNNIKDNGSLEVRLAARLASTLSAGDLPHDVNERLRVARDQAVTKARQIRQAQQASATSAAQSDSTSVVGTTRGGAAALGAIGSGNDQGRWPNWLASALPLLILVAGLMFISQWTAREQILVAAEIDTLLLADDLPPAAYTDPGFAEYLRSGPLR